MVRESLSLNGGAIVDPLGNEPDLRYRAMTFAGHPVVEVPPVLGSARTSQDGSQVIISFSEDIRVRPDLQTLSAFAGVYVGVYLRALIDVFVNDHRAHTPGGHIRQGPHLRQGPHPHHGHGNQAGTEIKVAYDDVFARDVPGVIVDHAANPLEHFAAQSAANQSTLPADADANWPVIGVYSLAIAEGGTGSYTVALGAQTSEDMTVSLSIAPETHLTTSHQALTFTPDNWATSQTITLIAGTDDDNLNFWQEIVHTSDAEGFIVGHLKVLIED